MNLSSASFKCKEIKLRKLLLTADSWLVTSIWRLQTEFENEEKAGITCLSVNSVEMALGTVACLTHLETEPTDI